MASAAPPPLNPSPSTVPSSPSNATSSPPLPIASPPNSSSISRSPPPAQPNAQPPSTPSTPSVPPPSIPAAPPPTPSLSPPPSTSPPPSPPTSPPPPASTSTPPPRASTPPPRASTPPPPASAPPPAATLPPPSLSPPPPSQQSPPPQASKVPPAATPPPTQPSLSSPPPTQPSLSSPPPSVVLSPPSSNASPPPPENSPSPPTLITPTPPPPPKENTPPASTISPPPAPTLPSPPSTSPAPLSNHSTNGSSITPPLSPSPTTNKPTAAAPSQNSTVNATSTNTGGINTGAAVGIGVVVSILALSLIVMAVWFVKKRKRNEAASKVSYAMPSPFASSEHSGPLVRAGSGSECMYSPSEPGTVGNSRSCFTYEELIEATKGFSVDNLLGEGGFGSVYKGCLVDGREVAVKQLKIGGGQGEREFKAEVEIISRIHHRHLVSLVGYCISEHQRLLVYDYVANDTLHYHLHGKNRPALDWATRFKVAAGAARGIAYLHEDCHPRIIHRDIKSSNILLDNNFEAQVSDFGLAKLALDAYTHVTTRVMGTFGYMAPEYASSGKLTEKSDIFSFGVVLLELITGRKPVDASQPLGDESLVEWARPLLTRALEDVNFEELLDPRLEKNFVESEMFRMIEAAAACVRHSASKRPRMSQIVRALDSIGDSSDLSNGMKPGQSEMFGPNSTQIRMFQRLAFGSQDYSSDFTEQSQSSWHDRSGNWHSSLNK